MLHISESRRAEVESEAPGLSLTRVASKLPKKCGENKERSKQRWRWRSEFLALWHLSKFSRLECPFAKSSAGCSQSVIQTAPAASSPVCVSLKSIKMLQIKLKVSTFFRPLPLSPSFSHSSASWAASRLGLGLGFGCGCGLGFGFRFRFRWGLASASFACATFSNDNYKSFCCTLHFSAALLPVFLLLEITF